jgi:hypothetical protein
MERKFLQIGDGSRRFPCNRNSSCREDAILQPKMPRKPAGRLKGPATLSKDKHFVYSTPRISLRLKASEVTSYSGTACCRRNFVFKCQLPQTLFCRATWPPFVSSNPFSIANLDLGLGECHLSVDLTIQPTRCCDTNDMAKDIFFPLLAV